MQTVKLGSTLGQFQISKADLIAYRQLSQDLNPVHEQGVVYGLQLMTYVAKLFQKPLTQCTYQFLKPVYVAQVCTVYQIGKDRFEVWCQQRRVGKGTFQCAQWS